MVSLPRRRAGALRLRPRHPHPPGSCGREERPTGGHAVYIDAGALLAHIPALEGPGQALACELYAAGGVRTCEIGSVMFGRRPDGSESPAPIELVRLAIPRRIYTQSHVDYVIEVVLAAAARARELRCLRIVDETATLRHFTARFEPLL